MVTLPLNPAATKKIAVVGPLENTLYSDLYGGNLPYKITPVDGITQRLGCGATVTTSEALDRIALQDVTTGKYVTAGTGRPAARAARRPDPCPDHRVRRLRLGRRRGPPCAAWPTASTSVTTSRFENDQTQPNGWFVQQQFRLDPQPDGTT